MSVKPICTPCNFMWNPCTIVYRLHIKYNCMKLKEGVWPTSSHGGIPCCVRGKKVKANKVGYILSDSNSTFDIKGKP